MRLSRQTKAANGSNDCASDRSKPYRAACPRCLSSAHPLAHNRPRIETRATRLLRTEDCQTVSNDLNSRSGYFTAAVGCIGSHRRPTNASHIAAASHHSSSLASQHHGQTDAVPGIKALSLMRRSLSSPQQSESHYGPGMLNPTTSHKQRGHLASMASIPPERSDQAQMVPSDMERGRPNISLQILCQATCIAQPCLQSG